MTARDFCYWLQGYFEIHGNRPVQEPESTYFLNESQINMIRNHLGMVFIHEIDPSFGGKKEQEKLIEAHAGGGLKPDNLSYSPPWKGPPVANC